MWVTNIHNHRIPCLTCLTHYYRHL
jgi:hypothetical protein